MVKRVQEALKKQKGFTLIEVLATVVILGIVAAIAVPAIGNIVGDTDDDAKITEALMIIDAAKLAKIQNPDETVFVYDSAETGEFAIKGHLDKVSDTDWTVTYMEDTREYKIVVHDANELENIGNTAYEDDLVAELNKTE